MAVSKDDIYRTALTLPEEERAELIGALLDSLDREVEEGVEEAWRTGDRTACSRARVRCRSEHPLGCGERAPRARSAWLSARFAFTRRPLQKRRPRALGTSNVTPRWLRHSWMN